ncbi:hypothetical protein FB480_101867 [Agrobacterium vitis]|nr:hypothetical protein FB480_101867 [Agrobacterium vitis]
MRSSLKDPTSPIFGGVAAAKSNKGLVNVCGIVNAKNSYGGYTGDQPYFGALAGKEPNQIFVVIGFGGTDSERYAVTEMCRRAGIGG